MSIISALVMLTLVGMLALTIDVGYAYGQRRMAQNVADSGSVAAAHVIAAHVKAGGQSVFTDADVSAAVRDVARYTSGGYSASVTGTYVDYAGASLGVAVGTGQCASGGTGCIPTGARGVRLAPRKSITSFFAGPLGFPTLSVGATATGIADVVVGFNTLSPNFLPYILWVGEDGCDHSQGSCGAGNYDASRDFRCTSDPLWTDPATGQTEYHYGCIPSGATVSLIYRDNQYSNPPNVSLSNPRWTAPSNTFKGFLRVDPNNPVTHIDDYLTQGGNAQGLEDSAKNLIQACYQRNLALANSCTLVVPIGDYEIGGGSNTQIRVVGWATIRPNEDPTGLSSAASWTAKVVNAPVEYGAVYGSGGGTPPPVGASIFAPRIVQ